VEAHSLTGLDLRQADGGWAFASDYRPRIDLHWQKKKELHPHIWNGEVLVCVRHDIRDGVLAAEFVKTDYASFVAWLDWGSPGGKARNCFGAPVVMSSDRAIIFGEMAVTTLNGGRIYPPSGSLEPRDIVDGARVDVLGSIAMELREETGLDVSEARPGQLLALADGHRLAVCQALAFPYPAEEIHRRFAVHSDTHAELAGLVTIRSAGDVSNRMPGFAQEIVRRFDAWFENA
jgi:8-oxo-dGTP pyrophosphatase MutT (NUDIX family)